MRATIERIRGDPGISRSGAHGQPLLPEPVPAAACGLAVQSDPSFGPGAVVQAQLWYRDPGSTSNQKTSLSDAIEPVLVPSGAPSEEPPGREP